MILIIIIVVIIFCLRNGKIKAIKTNYISDEYSGAYLIENKTMLHVELFVKPKYNEKRLGKQIILILFQTYLLPMLYRY